MTSLDSSDAATSSQTTYHTLVTTMPKQRRGLIREFLDFLGARKKWWLAPIIIVMALVGALLVFAQGSALAPFIYTIF